MRIDGASLKLLLGSNISARVLRWVMSDVVTE
jgi:hypothetical protein